jgi:hypothetical protein
VNVYVVGRGERGEGVLPTAVFTTQPRARAYVRREWPEAQPLRKIDADHWISVFPNRVDIITVDRLPLGGSE